MNLLKGHAELFVKGNFKMRVYEDDPDMQSDLVIDGICNHGLYLLDTDGEMYHKDDCTLIARPIEDMTVKEVSQINEDQFYGTTYQQVIRELKTVNINMRTDHALQVLDFGVYIGPQSHFDDGSVIDIREPLNT